MKATCMECTSYRCRYPEVKKSPLNRTDPHIEAREMDKLAKESEGF